MSVSIPIYVENPKDGENTFDKILLYRSDDSYAAIKYTLDIDLTTRNQFSPGYTLYADPSGETTYSYKAQYKNSTSGLLSPLTDAFAYGDSYIIVEARGILRDTDSANYVFSNTELQDMEARAVEELFPGIVKAVVDTSKTIQEDVIDYEMPVGAFRIRQVHKGALADDDWKEIDDFEFLRGRYLRLQESEVAESGDTLTIEYNRKYRDVGEVPAVIARGVILNQILAECYEILANDRGVKFKAYASQQRNSDVRPETLQALADKYRNIADRRRDAIEKG